MTTSLQTLIDAAWQERSTINAGTHGEVREAVNQVIADLNAGRIRVATREGVGQWTVHQWIKKAVLLSFRLNDNRPIHAGELTYYDKVDTKFSHMDAEALAAAGVPVRHIVGRGQAHTSIPMVDVVISGARVRQEAVEALRAVAGDGAAVNVS